MKTLVFSLIFFSSALSFGQTDCFFLTENFTGVCETLYPDGTVKIRAELKEGVRDGKTELFYPDGNPRAIANYLNGEFVRSISYFYVNGGMKWMIMDEGDHIEAIMLSDSRVIVQQGKMNRDYEPIGEWQFFDESGNEIKKVNMDDENPDMTLFVQPVKAARIPDLRVKE